MDGVFKMEARRKNDKTDDHVELPSELRSQPSVHNRFLSGPRMRAAAAAAYTCMQQQQLTRMQLQFTRVCSNISCSSNSSSSGSSSLQVCRGQVLIDFLTQFIRSVVLKTAEGAKEGNEKELRRRRSSVRLFIHNALARSLCLCF